MEPKGTYRFTMEATRDLHRIWRYTVRKWSPEQADLYFNELIETAKLIADNPALELDRSDIDPGIRAIRKNLHLIFYTVEPDRIVIARILHERMDLKRRLGKSI